jgi:hypothetical protein
LVFDGAVQQKGGDIMKQIVAIIVVAFAVAAILIGSLSAMISSHKGPQHEQAAVTHSAGSH